MKATICDRCKKPIFNKDYKNGDILKVDVTRIIRDPTSLGCITFVSTLDICGNCSNEIKKFIYKN